MNQAPATLPDSIEKAFRRGRARHAMLDGLLALALLVPAAAWSAGGERSFVLATSVFLGVVAFVYRGGEAGRIALPAVTLGMIPLACALLAPGLDDLCGPGGCHSFCVAACGAGGAAAGILSGRIVAQSTRPGVGFFVAFGLVGLTGSIGCACVGAAGVASLLVSLPPALYLGFRASREP